MKKIKRKIAVMAVLSSLVPTYSIAGVVHDQLTLLKEMGEDVVFITTDDFHEQDKVPEGIEVRYYPRHNFEVNPIKSMVEFEKYVFETAAIMRVQLKDITTVLTHDIIFLESFLAINAAMRKAAEEFPALKWLHWIHSGPSTRPLNLEYPYNLNYEGMPNSELIYLNRTDVSKLAKMYQVPENNIRVVHNFIDPNRIFKFHPITKEICDQYDLYEADTISVYPTRLCGAKQIDKSIKLHEKLKELGQSVRLIICNSWSNAQEEIDYLQTLRDGTSLTKNELIFTSELDSKWSKDNSFNVQLGIPRESIQDLLRIADLFILPSISEACSMIMLEAGMNKNLMVLNEDLWSLHEFGGQKMDGLSSERAIYMSFGSVTRPLHNYLPDEETWFMEHAKCLIDLQKANQSLQFFKFVRKRHTPKWTYLNEIKPLLQ